MATQTASSSSIPIRNVWHMLLYAWQLPRFVGETSVELEDSPNLVSLLARVLCHATCGLLRRGVHRDFREYEERLRFLRGRVDLLGSARRLELIHGTATCTYDELSEDVVSNRILRTSLVRLAARSDLPSELRQVLQILASRLPHVQILASVTSDLFGQVRIGRNNAIYLMLMEVCRLVWQLQLPNRTVGKTRFAGLLEDELIMSKVFESFVRNFYSVRFPTCDVRAEPLEWPVKGNRRYLPGMKTDISLTYASRRIVIDTKYYQSTLAEYYGTKMLHSENLYQLFAYLRTQEHRGDSYRQAEGVLLYPTVDDTVDERYLLQGHPVRVVTLDLRQEWRSIEAHLAKLIEPESPPALEGQ